MNIICNGKRQQVKDDISLVDLLAQLGFAPDTVVVEVNKRIIERDKYGDLHLHEGDQLELIRFVGGG